MEWVVVVGMTRSVGQIHSQDAEAVPPQKSLRTTRNSHDKIVVPVITTFQAQLIGLETDQLVETHQYWSSKPLAMPSVSSQSTSSSNSTSNILPSSHLTLNRTS